MSASGFDEGGAQPDGAGAAASRAARLKVALQANIARRKAQARARAAGRAGAAQQGRQGKKKDERDG